MLRLLRPALLTLTLTVPMASYALGLGDIHVESALHQPLIAQIELVGVAEDELSRVSAALASDELFQKYNLERAPFIYGTTLTVGRDAQGRPVLNMRSREKFTEPVVTLLVDLHSPGGELIREYTLFLDPAGLTNNAAGTANPGVVSTAGSASSTAATPNSGVGSSAAAPASAGSESQSAQARAADHAPPAPATSAPSVSPKLLGQTHTVARRDTLARIVAATGARSRTERHRMMIAIYRANPAAFQNNFNRMHTGVTLTFPTAEQLAAISVEESNREYDSQMAEWRASSHHSASATDPSAAAGAHKPAVAATNASASATDVGDPAAAHPGAGSAAARAAAAGIAATSGRAFGTADSVAAGEALPNEHAALTQRIASLEQSLAEIQQQLKRPMPVQTPVAPAAAGATATATSLPPVPNRVAAPALAAAQAAPAVTDEATSEDDEDDAPPVKHRGYQLIAIGAGAGLLFFAGAWLYLRRRNSYHVTPRYPVPAVVEVASEEDASDEESSGAVEFSTPPPPLPQTAAKANDPVESEQQPKAPKDAKNASSWFEDSFSTPIADLLNDPTVNLGVEETARLNFENVEPTVKLPTPPERTVDTEVLVAPELEFAGDTVEQKFSFFNPEASNNTEHVVMGSALNEPKPFVERRRNPADVLRQAIEREPDRSDLRLKLLELYYTAAAENRRAFLEATRQLTKNDKLATPEDWSRIADMGRVIAPDDELFAGGDIDDQRVA